MRKQKKLWHRCTLTGHWTTQGPRALRVRTAAVVSGWLNGWLIGWLYVVVGWYVAGKKKHSLHLRPTHVFALIFSIDNIAITSFENQ